MMNAGEARKTIKNPTGFPKKKKTEPKPKSGNEKVVTS